MMTKVIDLCQYGSDADDRDHRRLVPAAAAGAARGRATPSSSPRALKAIADPARLRLLSLIQAQPGHEACVCHLTEPLGLSQPTVSHHLKVLLQAGLVEREQRGSWAYFRVREEPLAALRGAARLSSGSAAPGPRRRRDHRQPLRSGSPVFTALTIAPCMPSATSWVNSTLTCSKPAASSPASYSPFESAPAMQPT